MRIGIDLGGTKIEIVVLDDSGTIQFRQRAKTPQGDYTQTLATIKLLVDQAESQLKSKCTIGIGTPGSISPHSGNMRNSNSVCLNDKPLLQDLEKLLERPVRLANDANCFALSEAVDGTGKDYSSVFGVILGTGVGGGLVLNKKLHQGANQNAGEWGHNQMPQLSHFNNKLPREMQQDFTNTKCYCGNSGCIETFLSGPGWLHHFYGVPTEHSAQNNQQPGDLQPSTQQLSAKKIVEKATAGDQSAKLALDTYYYWVSAALSQVINWLDPDIIVLGGGMSNIPSLTGRIREIIPKLVFCDHIDTVIETATYGDSSGVRGAAWLWQ